MATDFQIKDERQFEFMWRHNGSLGDGSNPVSLQDALSTPNASVFLPKVITNVVKEAVEPMLIGTSLLQRMNYRAGQLITLPTSMGPFVADRIPEGGEYKEASPQLSGGTVISNIGKFGLAIRVTEEMIRYSQYDIISMMLRKAGAAMGRLKETQIWDMIRAGGVKVFDNLNPTQSLKGVTTGRGFSGAGNGSLTMDDLFDAISQVMMQGYMANTLIMHPLTWNMFVKDPTLRSFALASGGGTFFGTWQGNPSQRAPWSNGAQGDMGLSGGQAIVPGGNAASLTASELLDYPQTLDSKPTLPSYFGMPISIVVSPFVPFDPSRLLTDIYVCDRSGLGALIVDEELTTEEFRDPRVDITKIKIRERYALALLNEGLDCAVIKNVHVVPNEIVLPAHASIDVSSTLMPIGPTDSVL